MKRASRSLLGLLLFLLGATPVVSQRILDREEHDALAAERLGPFAVPAGEPAPGLVKEGTVMQMEERLGVPTFVWAGSEGSAPRAAAGLTGPVSLEATARGHFSRYASLYRLDQSDIESAHVRFIHDTGRGPIIVSFGQKVDGIEVFRDNLALALRQDRSLLALSGFLTRPDKLSHKFILGEAEAIAMGMSDLTDFGFVATDLRGMGETGGGYRDYRVNPMVEATSGIIAVDNPRIKPVWFRLTGGIEPAYALELNLSTPDSKESSVYSYVISAVDGRVLFRHNLTVSDSFTYRVWADTTGDRVPLDGPQGPNGVDGTPHPTASPDGYQAPFQAPVLVTLESGPISTGDPWLPNGATETNGNNVDAYADLVAPDGFNPGDLRADTTSADTFDRIYNTGFGPGASTNQRKASVTQLFYTTNWLHDWFYDSGFDEMSGNAQADNYGRGGIQNDSLRAEAQDYSSRNNATMATPADGGRPRMHMFVFDGNGLSKIELSTPPAIAGDYPVGTAAFGPQAFDVTGDVVYGDDQIGPDIHDGCEEMFNVAGKIALVDRGNCNFTVKVFNGLVSGATAVIVANNVPGVINMGGTGTVNLPSLLMDQADGQLIKDQLPGVTARLLREASTDRDGTLDNQIVAHEWGHYISNRLVGNANGLNTNMSAGLGEGWGDFHALLMTVRPEDANHPANADFNGVYALATYVSSGGINDGYYFGIRRTPYSTSFAFNPLTFKHIANGQVLPATAPISFGADGSNNSEVHNTGEIWANMLWECYASMLRDTLGVSPRLTFEEARQRMRDYLVAAYKLTPNSPTLIEARDAVLASALAGDPLDYVGCFQGFAKRGAGVGAQAPDRFSVSNIGVVESFLTGGELELFDATLIDDISTNCLPDGDLDTDETGTLMVTLRNTGSESLSATTGSVTSTNPNVSFPSGNALSFPSASPFNTMVASVPVSLSGAVLIEEITFDLSFDDPGLAIAGPRMASVSLRGNANDPAGTSSSDDVESNASPWSVSFQPGLSTSYPWERTAISGINHLWLGPDSDAQSDHYLVSPPLQVGAAGTFSFSFSHRFDFESTFDGGVIELSNNGGGSWIDIGTSASPTYNDPGLVTGGGNPIEARPAFSGQNAAYPSFETVTVDLGSAWQGQTVLIRFRIGTDVFVGATGWEIDDLVFNNIDNTPFPFVGVHDPTCDGDTDGFFDAFDCAPGDGNLWSVPSPVLDLTASVPGPGSVQWGWSLPANPGGAASPTYDLVRVSTMPEFGSATCMETGDTDLTATDPAAPGDIYYYMVGAVSGCGRSFATDSVMAERSVTSCP